MSLAGGVRLGPYEIVSPLGEGGMGEVYRAKDARLNRTVAIKILRQESAGDSDRRERFEREAKAISALDHPNICALYDVGDHEGTYYLVMPCLEGQTLADRLAKGALPVDQAIKHAIEIATALDAAHRHGIVHRDLKPGNIMLTRTGVKLLDFGLAKLKKDPGPMGNTTISSGTGIGTLLGTMPYMAPEQVEGRDVDARSDIFALVAVIYEMVTGQRAFKGDSPASVIGAILKDEPAPIKALRPLAPSALDFVVTTCLAKDPDERWQSAADIARQLMRIASAGADAAAAATPRMTSRTFRASVAAAAIAVAALSAAAWSVLPRTAAAGAVVRFRLEPLPGTMFVRATASLPIPLVSISPDGRQIGFVAAEAGRQGLIWVRAIDEVLVRPLPGTNGAQDPFWSPDSQSIGFFADGRLKRVEVTSGTVQDLCEASFNPRGGTWNADGTILFGDAGSGIRRVSASGGGVQILTTVTDGAGSHRWPSFLPDGRHFLFYLRGANGNGIYVGSLDGDAPKKLLDGQFNAVYAEGHLLTVSNGTLFAHPFDASRLAITGDPLAIAGRGTGIAGASTNQSAIWVSNSGVLVYASGFKDSGDLIWFDRDGKTLGTPVQSGNILHFRLSPDESQLATTVVDQATNTSDIWISDLRRGSTTRLTSDPANDLGALWSRDGTRLVFRSDRVGTQNLFERSSQSGVEDRLLARIVINNPTDWSPDGRFVLFHTPLAGMSQDIQLLNVQDESVTPFLNTRFQEYDGRFSPDGRWVAYTSEESGRPEIHVRSFPSLGEKTVVSTGGGSTPRWRNDGKELFYLGSDDRVMAVPVETGRVFRAGAPKALFQTRTLGPSSPFVFKMEVSGNGQRFLVNRANAVDATPITVLVNWQSALPQR